MQGCADKKYVRGEANGENSSIVSVNQTATENSIRTFGPSGNVQTEGGVSADVEPLAGLGAKQN